SSTTSQSGVAGTLAIAPRDRGIRPTKSGTPRLLIFVRARTEGRSKMAFQATVFDVLIASPKDVPKARGLAEHECHDWTGSRAREEGVVLRPRRHETDSVPLI